MSAKIEEIEKEEPFNPSFSQGSAPQNVYRIVGAIDQNTTRKLIGFKNIIKKPFGYEEYLWINLSYQSTSGRRNLPHRQHGSLAELPFFDPILEDEAHARQICPLYDDTLCQATRVCLNNDQTALFVDQ